VLLGKTRLRNERECGHIGEISIPPTEGCNKGPPAEYDQPLLPFALLITIPSHINVVMKNSFAYKSNLSTPANKPLSITNSLRNRNCLSFMFAYKRYVDLINRVCVYNIFGNRVDR
jgi:hypothetical protein